VELLLVSEPHSIAEVYPPTFVKPFDVFAKGSETGDWLAALDGFRNWLIRERPK